MPERIPSGSDHAGYEMKAMLADELRTLGYEVEDVGSHSPQPTDYADYAHVVAREIEEGEVKRGILLCGTGLGMSYAANRHAGVRAAVAWSPEVAHLAKAQRRQRPGAAVAIPRRGDGARHPPGMAQYAVRGRTPREADQQDRVAGMTARLVHDAPLSQVDPAIAKLIDAEVVRQRDGLELIASENFTSRAVLQAMGTALTNKYAEGYPGKRYYGGCEIVDQVEQLAIDRVKQLYDVAHANVQPHSGVQANFCAYMALMPPGETILGMSLPHGGHLSHGTSVSHTGQVWKSAAYGVRPESGLIDYDEVREIAKKVRPKLIIAGGSAYAPFSTSRRFAASPTKWAPSSWSTWRTSPGWLPVACTLHRSRTRTSPQHHAQDAPRPARRADPLSC